MEEIDFPISYTDGIKEIYFTNLKGSLYGDYTPSTSSIRLSCSRKHIGMIHNTFIHEVGHHVDEIEGCSDTMSLIKEHDFPMGLMQTCMELNFEQKPKGLYGEYGVNEYFALGFELYYSHELGREKCRKHTTLNEMINELHKRTK